MPLLMPVPDAQGIRETKEAYKKNLGKDLSDAEAYEVLGRVMRYLFLINNPCFDMPSMPESPTMTPQSPKSP